ncbi:MAG: NAD-dependent succinate-semialdehyde dehydrogenase, partial [Ahrensia sp.]
TGQPNAKLTAHTPEDVERAVENADLAYQDWRKTAFSQRAQVMHKAADLLEERKEHLATLAVSEMGKRIAEARAEVEKCAWVCRYYADNAEALLADEPLESDAKQAYVRYLPIGIVLAVMPWNFPFWQVFRFAAPTLMAGNVGILKHASSVPQCALAIEEIFTKAGAPNGVFTSLLVGSDMVTTMIEDERVRAVTLTGSEPAGRAVAKLAGEQIKPSLLELGGSDPFVVMPSADLNKAVETAIKARMINNGQSCIAAKRFIVHADVYDTFVAKLVDRVSAMTIGDPMDEATDMGPLSSEEAKQTLLDQLASLQEDGATVLCGGKSVERPGFFVEPAVVSSIPENARERKSEIFGPVAMVFRAESLDDALDIANETPFGLASSFWSKQQDEIDIAINRLEAGGTFINSMVASDPRLPFGGIKNSGYGRELAQNGITAFMNVKTISIVD